jgi:hypothetical protein
MSRPTMVPVKKNEKPPRKKEYQKPTLDKYGRARDLTTAGSCIAGDPSPDRQVTE